MGEAIRQLLSVLLEVNLFSPWFSPSILPHPVSAFQDPLCHVTERNKWAIAMKQLASYLKHKHLRNILLFPVSLPFLSSRPAAFPFTFLPHYLPFFLLISPSLSPRLSFCHRVISGNQIPHRSHPVLPLFHFMHLLYLLRGGLLLPLISFSLICFCPLSSKLSTQRAK